MRFKITILCKDLVQLMGGQISVSSEPGSGSCFSFEVLLKKVSDQNLGVVEQNTYKTALASAQLEGKLNGPASGRILLVEDNAINVEVALGLLEDFGVEVDWACNGLDAVEKLRGTKDAYDLVLMDIQMPEMDGYEACKYIRSELKLRSLPIIAMTANVMKGEREKCFDAGMNDFIPKPIEPDFLEAKVRQWLLGVPGS
ncbi:MAG: response regulator [bacterium]|nr:response regulator [Gammaproteobacteria bacterium]